MDDLDLIDRKILGELMRDATVSVAQLAERVGLSQTPCWKRVQKLEAAGIIQGRVALVDPVRIGFALTVFVGIEAPDHGAEWRQRFGTVIDSFPEILDAHRLAGDLDYLLRVATRDMAAYDGFYRRLTEALPIRNITSHFVMERLKAGSAYPLDTVNR